MSNFYDPTSSRLKGSTPDSLNEIIKLLRQLDVYFNSSISVTVTGASGLATETTLSNIETLETNIDSVLTSLDNFIQTTLDRNVGAATAGTLRTVLSNESQSELETISTNTNVLNTLDKNGGVITANTLRVVLDDNQRNVIDDIAGNTNATEAAIITYGDKENWDRIAGNSIEYDWIDGNTVIPNTTIQKRLINEIRYKTGVAVIFKQSFTYNANDEVISVVTTV
jgi:hypothetical protein